MAGMRVNRRKVVSWEVEEHLGGREGVGKGPRTGSYETYEAALQAMVEAKADLHGATCIARNASGQGKALVLGLMEMF